MINDVRCKSHEQRLITKAHMAMLTNLIYTPLLTFQTSCKPGFVTSTICPHLKLNHFFSDVQMVELTNTALLSSPLAVAHDTLRC